MSFFGVDLASGPDRTVVSLSTHEGSVGERVWLGQSNRHVSRIRRVLSATAFEFITYRRPTRGYARHIRRQKQRARR